MTVIPWADGNILTAGSLRVIPQYYGTTGKINGTGSVVIASGNAYTSAGSMFISGGLFSEKLLCLYSIMSQVSTSANTFVNSRLFVSGVGLGGGSQVSEFAPSDLSSANSIPSNGVFVEIGSNAGWIPGSDCFIYVQTKAAAVNGGFSQLTVWGTGKP